MATDTPDNGRAEAPPVDTDIAEILGLLTRGYVHSAAERAANLLQIRPEHAEAQRLYGVALFRMNQRESAIAALSRAVELAPENAAASWGLAEALQAAGRTAEAERRLEVLLDGRPDDAVGLLMLARLRLEASDPAGALELARRALSVDPQVAGGRALLAALAYGQGDFAAVNETLLPARLSAGRQGAEADPACLLARSLYAAGRNRDLARLPMAQTPAQRHSEAVLLALAAYRENNSNAARRALAQAEAERPAARSAAEAATEGTSGVAMFASLGELLSTLLRQPEEKPELYAGEVAHIVGLIGDSHVLSAGHLVVPWQGHKALLLPEVLLEAAPSALLAEPPEAQTAPLKAALSAAWDRLPKGAIPAVCLGELDLRLTQGLFSRAHALSETELQARLQELAARLAAYVAAEGKVRGTLPILVTPPASNAPLSLLPEDVRLRFAAANRRFVGTLRQAADRLRPPPLGPRLQRRQQAVQVGQQDVGRLGELDGQRGVQQVGGGHALVDEARLLAHRLGQVGQEGDDVVPGLRLDGVDLRGVGFAPALDQRRAPLPDRLGRRLGDDAQLGQGVAGVRLDLEPDAELVGRSPDGGHLRTAVARNHSAAGSGRTR